MTRSTLDDWLCWIEQQHPSEIEMGLERVATVAARLQLSFTIPVVTVAGTNGKGSCVSLLAAILENSGYRCGCYTSPHLLHYNERVTLSGRHATDAELIDAFGQVEQARGETPLTYFEFGTLAALWLFYQSPLDLLILEVGLGGRLDAVNIVDADIAIISSVDLDHQSWLGETREQIGLEKAGIMRAGKPALFGDVTAVASVFAHAHHLGAPLLRRDEVFGFQLTGERWQWWGQTSSGEAQQLDGLPLPRVLLDNAATVLQALALLPVTVSREAIEKALVSACPPGRGQLLNFAGQHLRLNVGHNPAALRAMLTTLPALPPGGRRIAVFAALADKAVADMLTLCAPAIDFWHAVQLPQGSRTLAVAEIGSAMRNANLQFAVHDSVAGGLVAALAEAGEGDEILVFGSFLTVSEALAELNRSAPVGTLDNTAGQMVGEQNKRGWGQ